MDRKFQVLTCVEKPKNIHIRERYCKLTLLPCTKKETAKSPERCQQIKEIAAEAKGNDKSIVLTDDESDNDNKPVEAPHTSINRILLTPSDEVSSKRKDESTKSDLAAKQQSSSVPLNLKYSDSEATICTLVDFADRNKSGSDHSVPEDQIEIPESTPAGSDRSKSLFSRSSTEHSETNFMLSQNKNKFTEYMSSLSSQMSTMGLKGEKKEEIVRTSTVETDMEPLVYEATIPDELEVTVISDDSLAEESRARSGITIESSSADESEEEEILEKPKKKKEKVILISDTESDDDGELKDEDYSNVVSNIQDDSQVISQTAVHNLNRFFDNIPPLSSTERFSFLKQKSQPDDDEHAEKMDKSNEKEKLNDIVEERDVVSATDESLNQPDVPDVEHVEISESSEGEDAENTPVQHTPVSLATTEPNTDLVPSEEVLNTPVSAQNNVINISAKIKINIQVSYRGGSTSSGSTVAASSSSDSGGDAAKKKVSKVRNKIHHKFNKKVHLSFDDKDAPETSEKKRQSPKTKRKNTPKKTGSKSSKNLANEREQEKQQLPADVPQSNQNLFEESNDEEEPIDENMEAMLNEVYGNEWRTPAMLRACVSVKKSMPTRNRTTNHDFSLFDKKQSSHLESTRLPSLDRIHDSKSKNSEAAETYNSSRASEIVTSPFFAKTPTAAPATPVPTTASKLTEIRVKRQIELQSHRKQALAVCDSDSELSDNTDDEGSSEASWKCSRNSTDTDESLGEARAVTPVAVKKPVRKPAARKPAKKPEPIQFLYESDPNKENEDAQNESITKKVLGLLESCEFKRKPVLSATPNLLDNTECSILKTKRKLFSKRYTNELTGEFLNIPDQDSTTKSFLNESLIKDDVILKMPIPEFLFKPAQPLVNKKLEKVKDLLSGEGQPKVTKKKTVAAKDFNEQKVTDTKSKATARKLDFAESTTTYGFLQSLDVTLSKHCCHPEALAYRENYKAKKEELATRLFQFYNEKVFDNRLIAPITWNKKLLNTAGRCHNSKKLDHRTSRIELSDKVLTSADRLRCTLIHEMCHAATWIFNDENSGHGKVWKAWAYKANKTFPELPTIGTCHDYKIEYKYTYQCILCKAKYHAHSKSKKVENIRCSRCKGSIEVFLNKKDKAGNVVATPVREASGFAKFVKEQYKTFKTPDLKHADVMKLLSGEFAALKVDRKE